MSRRFEPDPYAQYRPNYPAELFEWLRTISPRHCLAWDAGTGTGQASIGLAQHFAAVAATDVDRSQIDRAIKHSKVTYHEAPAEISGLGDGTVDLAVAACAAHWFDQEKYYDEVRRVLVNDGVVALWTYTWPEIGVGAVDEILARYRDRILGQFWPAEAKYYFDHYRSLPFPFEVELPAPHIELQCDWDAEGLLAFLGTWSGAHRYREANGRDPSSSIRGELIDAWRGADLGRGVTLPLYFRVARVARSN